MGTRVATLIAVVGLACASSAAAENDALVAGIIRRVPRTTEEVAAAHEKSTENACQPVDAKLPLEMSGFDDHVTYEVQSTAADGRRTAQTMEFDVSRRTALAAGACMTPADQENLPLVSGSTILHCVNDFYIAVQLRVHRRTPNGVPHLFYRPFGAVASYADPQRTQAFVDLVRNSISEFRSLGLFLKPDEQPTAEALRTLVLVNKNVLVTSKPGVDPPQTRPAYEYMFVRARPNDAAPGDLRLYTFLSSNGRQRLHYLGQYETPKTVDDCGVKTTIIFTEYGFGGLHPISRASRSTEIHGEASYPMSELDALAKRQAWRGDALDNLTETLDAVIDGKVKP
ncbi:MAG TPA: hypothetical protein VHZ24_05845 [Pirellulales bacterium]|nr:hypothetical protein [Pirellulales bacterium]